MGFLGFKVGLGGRVLNFWLQGCMVWALVLLLSRDMGLRSEDSSPGSSCSWFISNYLYYFGGSLV